MISSAIRLGSWIVRVTRSTKPGSPSSRAATLTLIRMPSREQLGLVGGASQDPVADRRDQLRVLLGDGQEAARREQALLGVLPAHERLEGDDAERVELPDRLVLEPQFVELDRPAEAVLELEPVAQPALHRAVEDLERAAAAGLDALQRGVGVLDEVGAVAVLDGDADRGGQLDAVDRLLERVRQSLGERGGGAFVVALGQYGELVAAEARERLGDVERLVQRAALLEEQAVRQAGQRVVQRLVDDPVLQPARLGDVGEADHQPALGQRLVVGRDGDRSPVGRVTVIGTSRRGWPSRRPLGSGCHGAAGPAACRPRGAG